MIPIPVETEPLLEQLSNYIVSLASLEDIPSSKEDNSSNETVGSIECFQEPFVSEVVWLSVGGCPRSGTTAGCSFE